MPRQPNLAMGKAFRRHPLSHLGAINYLCQQKINWEIKGSFKTNRCSRQNPKWPQRQPSNPWPRETHSSIPGPIQVLWKKRFQSSIMMGKSSGCEEIGKVLWIRRWTLCTRLREMPPSLTITPRIKKWETMTGVGS